MNSTLLSSLLPSPSNSTSSFKTVTTIRCELAEKLEFGDNPTFVINALAKPLINGPSFTFNLRQALNSLKFDIIDILKYRNEESDAIDIESFNKWFPNVTSCDASVEILQWIDSKRDFIYNSHGLRLLKNRYLMDYEPIQYCMLRIAKLFTQKDKHGKIINLKEWRIMYDAISCGFMHTSSVLADAENANDSIVPGEACRLLVSHPGYDRAFVNQINEICNLVSLGVGVGMSASTVPLHGYKTPGKIRSGFKSFAKKLDSCNYLTIYERKPKIAVYIEMHNDTIYEAFELRHPLKTHLENVFVGVMIPDYFIECYENDKDWYLFPGNAQLDGKTLCEFTGDAYKTMFQRFVDAKLYTRIIPSAKLMDDLVTCISETGSPYVIWSDNVNHFSNHKHLGKIKTLNLCAEITNFASVEKSSSCTLMSINYAMYKDFPEALSRIYEYVDELSSFKNTNKNHDIFNGFKECIAEFEHTEMSKYTYAMGFIGTWALNRFMGVERTHRELGISPLGVHDMAMIGNVDPIDIVAEVSEAMYKGCIHSSCKYSKQYNVQCEYYKESPFSQGVPQWLLRNDESAVSTNWDNTFNLMAKGMANSQLTAQAPTATTSMLVGASESVTLPMSIIMARESENGRNDLICYGILCKILNDPKTLIDLKNDIDHQVLMYKNSAPFVDQSQSTMFSLVLNRQNILDLIMETYYARLKTAIYYILPKQVNNTLTIVRKSSNAKEYYKSMITDNNNGECSFRIQNQSNTNQEDCPIPNKRPRRPSCDACSG